MLKSEGRAGLEFGYQHQLFKQFRTDEVDLTPSHLFIRIHIDFKKDTAIFQTDTTLAMLRQARARQSKMFVFLKTCPQHSDLAYVQSVFNKHFSYAPVEVIKDRQIDSVLKAEEHPFFILVGEHFAGLGEPQNIGIFLLDEHLKLVEYPAPAFTMYIERSDPCMSNDDLFIQNVKWFNRRLYKILE